MLKGGGPDGGRPDGGSDGIGSGAAGGGNAPLLSGIPVSGKAGAAIAGVVDVDCTGGSDEAGVGGADFDIQSGVVDGGGGSI